MRNDFGIRPRAKLKQGKRVGKQLGGIGAVGGTARRDMRSGYYPDDMGMRGGPMYEKGGRVGLRARTFKKGGRALKKGRKKNPAQKKPIVEELKA